MGRIRRLSSRERGGCNDSGMSILEVVLALTLFAVIVVGLAASTGAGLRLTGISNGRQQGTEVAIEYIERLRATDFESLGHPSVDSAVFNGGAGTPDEDVDLVAGTYDSPLDNAPANEELVDLAAGGIDHFEQASVGSRDFDIYAFVTWANEVQEQKRVTVVVRYSGTDSVGRPNEVAMSSVFMPGEIDHRPSVVTTTTSTVPTSSTSSTSTTVATCPGDTAGPTFSRFEILDSLGPNGVSYVTSKTLSIAVSASDPCTPVKIAIREGASGPFSTPSPLAADPDSVGFTLAGSDGTVTVFGQVSDGANNVGSTRSDTVVLDTTAPSSASNLVGTIKNSSQVDLSWKNSATDANGIAKYIVYRRVGADPAPFNAIATVTIGTGSGSCRSNAANCSYSDSTVSTQSYTYRVVAVDNAGNASPASNEQACLPTSSSRNAPCS